MEPERGAEAHEVRWSAEFIKKEWATGHTYEWSGLPPNYDDIEESADSPMGETVEIDQSDPQSNAIHIAHNIPTGSKVSPLYFPDA